MTQIGNYKIAEIGSSPTSHVIEKPNPYRGDAEARRKSQRSGDRRDQEIG
ncbi:MAG TPA: hypothetical protein VFB79_05185 [Candidatus Angelobacter sp.]|nr:hypothetical protein [Candidatus Angelobacter sp.]